MNITCKDLLELNLFQSCQLLTGNVGLDNIISFPFITRSISEDNLFIKNEFVMIADPLIPYTEENLSNFINICSEKKVSGILFFLNEKWNSFSELPDSVITLAKQKDMPVFQSDWCAQSVNFVREISLYINDARLRHNSVEIMLRDIFFFQNDETTLQRLLNTDLHNSNYKLVRIQFFNFEEYCEQHNLTTELQRYEQRLFIKRILGTQIINEFPGYPFCSHKNIAIMLCQDKDISSRTIVNKLKNIKEYMHTTFPELDIRFCVSHTYSDLRDISSAFHETFHLISLTNIEQFHNRIVSYSKIGVYQLFLSTPKKILLENYHSIMRPLLEYDAENNSDLLITLRCYLTCDCNIDTTSEKLFIHKNTIRYRLKRIEEIMDCSLKSSETITMLYYCMSIYDYVHA